MTLRELIDALQKAPPEALDQDVLMSMPESHGCKSLHIAEAIRFKDLVGNIQPWQVVLSYLDIMRPDFKLYPENDRRKYLSDVSGF